jgi:SAM-dependent methyltransferase
VLEIGCGAGHTLDLIKRLNMCESTVGIEIYPNAAESARARVDEVYQLDIENEVVPVSLGRFDLILFLDVLEHLVNPWGVLKRIRRLHLNEGGKIIISLPNVRHFTCVLPLLLRGEFSYQERGILDETHLRFFTRSSGAQLIQSAGLHVERLKPTSLDWRLNCGKLNILTLGLFSDFLASQFIYITHAVKE